METKKSVLLVAGAILASHVAAANLKVMKVGLGSGTVTSPAGINCGTGGTACDLTSSAAVTLTADPASSFVKWDGDCAGTAPTCNLTLGVDRSVRAEFRPDVPIPEIGDFTPEGIRDYLAANPTVNSPARFLKALPAAFKQGWILMTRSESLQTGTAELPRILLSSIDATAVFTIGMGRHSSYPGAHPNAIEYMQWDPVQKNFRFHEVVLDTIPEMGDILFGPGGTTKGRFAPRSRGIAIDDAKCSKCHSTRNVLALDRSVFPPVPGSSPGTDGVPPGSIRVKNKPNWDTYDSWAGMLPFNRDRIYQGSVEAAAFRKLLNPWTWRAADSIRSIVEQLELQPPGVLPEDSIDRVVGGADDGKIRFAFETAPPASVEPLPAGPDPAISTNYAFNGLLGTGPLSNVVRGGAHVRLRHPSDLSGSGEGRGVQLFDLLGGADGNLNPQRIADELIHHRFATGSVPIDVRPLVLAITRGDLTVANAATLIPAAAMAFFDARNGMTLGQVVLDTRARADTLPRRKADLQKLNLDRSGDVYLDLSAPQAGLIQQYGAATSQGTGTALDRLRQDVFRRPRDLGSADATVMSASSVITGSATPAEAYVDRELESPNTEKMALYRYFLEPLGVSVDKWSMGVRGRSRTYTFADVFGAYTGTFSSVLDTNLRGADPFPGLVPPLSGANLIAAVNASLASLPAAEAVPTYTDVQRIFNKSCIECHGGLNYPPVSRSGVGYLDFSENENPAEGDRLTPSHTTAASLTSVDPATSYLFRRITQGNEDCPDGIMPCGGPPLSKTDVETIRRWIVGSTPNTAGDPHIKTVDGTHYDFQSAGEFVLLRGENLEIQVRQGPVETETPLGPNPHTGLSSCVSLNTAAAIRVGRHRITYQPNLSGVPDASGLQLRVDGKLLKKGVSRGLILPSGGRILPTTAPGGIQIEIPGGTDIVITPAFWVERQVWYMNIDVRHARATEGIMGAIAPGNWLPALPDGTLPGPRPADLHQRYLGLYETFADAWRVDDATSLFDYAPGTSTRTFTLGAWPFENPQTCRIPGEEIPVPVVTAIPRGLQGGRRPGPMPRDRAERLCRAIVEPDRRENCVLDVMVTGEPGFARTYLLTQRIQLNKVPAAPKLIFPADNKTGLGRTVSMAWKKTRDADGDGLTYRHCLWGQGEPFTFNNCRDLSKHPSWRGKGHFLSIAISKLKPGKTYFWKVLAEDGQGGTVESESRRFTVGK